MDSLSAIPANRPNLDSYPAARDGEYVLNRWLWVPRPLEEVFPFFARAENLGIITPPELKFRIRSDTPIEMRKGTLIDYTIGLYGVPMMWRTEITHWEPPYLFEDTQVKGPYANWIHLHQFVEDAHGTTIIDRVNYALPFGRPGRIARPIVSRQLKRIFDYRGKILQQTFA